MPLGALAARCPRCGEHAPIVLRGLESRCAACGAPRFHLSAPSVSLAGQPSRLGGLAAAVAGWAVLLLGLSLALALWFLVQAIWPGSPASFAVALPVAVASLFFGILLLVGGSRLRRSGEDKRRSVRRNAVRALVAHRGDALSAREVSEALHLEEAEADALLVDLARESGTAVSIDVDEAGEVRYDFRGGERRWRVLEEQAAGQPPGELEESEPADRARSRTR